MADRIDYDGFTGLEKGVNNGLDPEALPRNQVANAFNTRFRGLFAECRPGFNQFVLNFIDDCQELFETGLFQGAEVYYPIDGKDPVILASISGHIFLLQMSNDDPAQWSVTDITIIDETANSGYDENVSTLDLAFLEQADQYLIIGNGVDRQLIFDGAALRRATDDEVPVCLQMAYGKGRVFVVLPDGNTIAAGDIVGGPTSVLNFSEYRLKNDAFAIDPSYGKITGLQFISQLDTSLGQGPLIASTAKSITAFAVTTDRDAWTTTTNFQTDALLSSGFSGPNAFTIVNSDTWYRSRDGIRSFVVARRNFGQWSNTPKSYEIQETIRYDNDELLKYISIVEFDNRLIVTARPKKESGRWWCEAMIALDFNPLAAIQQADYPAYDGLWTGFNPTQLLTLDIQNRNRCLGFAVSSDGKNQLWEISKDDDFDNKTCRIQWGYELGAYDWNVNGQRKRIRSGEYWIDRLRGQVDFSWYFRPDEYPFWQPWFSDTETADNTCPEPEPCAVPQNVPYQYRSRLTLPQPESSDNTLTDGQMIEGFSHQIKIAITGRCRIKKARIAAYVLPNEVTV